MAEPTALARDQQVHKGLLRPKSKGNEILITNVLFLTPAVILLIAYIIYPIINTVYLSFVEWNGIDPQKTFIGLDNWRHLINDPVFWKAFGNNLKIVVLSIAIQIPLGFLIAVMLTEMKQFSRFLKTAYFLPMLMSSVAIGILYKNILNPHFGVLASVLGAFGLKTLDLLGSRSLSLLTVSLIISWEYTPFYMVLFLSAITTISNDIREYAMIDGANRFQYYTSIVLPLLTGHVQTAIILSLIGSLKYFDLIFVLTNGGPANSTELLATYMYRMAFTSYKMGYGSAIAFALFAIVVIFSLTTQWISKKLNRDGNESW